MSLDRKSCSKSCISVSSTQITPVQTHKQKQNVCVSEKGKGRKRRGKERKDIHMRCICVCVESRRQIGKVKDVKQKEKARE